MNQIPFWSLFYVTTGVVRECVCPYLSVERARVCLEPPPLPAGGL
jgi:hypothetical protein